MKKRILALALAGTTAFSVFGGLNVFAADPAEKYVEYDVANNKIEWDSTNLKVTVSASPSYTLDDSSATTIDTYQDALSALVFDTDATVSNGKVYMMDYEVKADADADAFEELYALIDNILAADDFNDVQKPDEADKYSSRTEVKTALDAAFKACYGDATFTLYSTNGDYKSDRRAVCDEFEKFADGIENGDEEDYLDDDVAAYAFGDLIDDIVAVKDSIASTRSSYMLSLMQQYETILELISPEDTTDVQDWIDHYIEVLDLRSADDFKTASGYKQFDATYTELVENNEDASTLSDLRDYEDALWNLVLNTGRVGESAGVDKTALGEVLDLAEEYEDNKEDYGYVDGTVANDSAEYTYFKAIYDQAKAIDSRVKSYSYQSTVDAYVDYLTDAIDGLDPNSAVKDWAILYLETEVEEAEALVETDYTSASWKKVVSALESAQKALDSSNLSTTRATTLAEALNTAVEGLTVKAVPAATKTALKNTLSDAKDMLDEMTDSASGTQLLGLTNAINDAEDLWKTKYSVLKGDTLISEVEAATAALENAMTLAQHPQGWYQDENGTWFYGEGTGNKTGWLELNGRTYFLKDDGSMAANTWVKTEKGYWYYLNASGAMLHDGWAKINDTWYFFKNFGGMAEGWVKDGNTWYYLTPGSGAMVSNGWSLINGKYYYFNASGAMLANTTTPDGYKVDASGAWVK